MPTVSSMLADDNRLVQKHGTQILAIADYSAAVPTSWFAAPTTGGLVLPNALPAGYKNMGFITTDGITESNDVSTSDVMMVQSIEPVRSDIDSITKTLGVTFGESSAWTQALAQQIPVGQWPADKTAAWEYHDGGRTEFPYYRLFILTQDGEGDGAIYRAEYAYRAKITDRGDRTLQRSDAEQIELTFTCYVDPVAGRSYTKASTGVFVKPAA